ncbi:DUF2202 domain-containing protein [candidate division KSB1 bacterium]|nr:DUF2202 domain-containing protein [candidate division KSB1 bacterium]
MQSMIQLFFLISTLLMMREEEKLARDVYLELFDKWNLRIFSSIANSEQQHIDMVAFLLQKYDLADPLLIEQGMESLLAGLNVGVTIEYLDIYDLQEALFIIDHQDIRLAYLNTSPRKNWKKSSIRIWNEAWLMKMAIRLLSIHEAAEVKVIVRPEGVTDGAIRYAIKQGRLKKGAHVIKRCIARWSKSSNRAHDKGQILFIQDRDRDES